MRNLSFENEFYLHENKESFSCKQLRTKLRCETEAWGNTEMARFKVATGLSQVFTLKAFYFSRVFVDFCFQPLPEVGCIIQEIEHSLLKEWIYLFLRY